VKKGRRRPKHKICFITFAIEEFSGTQLKTNLVQKGISAADPIFGIVFADFVMFW
jgi:hypothetical protein